MVCDILKDSDAFVFMLQAVQSSWTALPLMINAPGCFKTSPPTQKHSSISQKAWTFSNTVVRTSNFTIDVYYENHRKHTNTLCGQNANFLKYYNRRYLKLPGVCKQCSHSGQQSRRGRKLGWKIDILKEKKFVFCTQQICDHLLHLPRNSHDSYNCVLKD